MKTNFIQLKWFNYVLLLSLVLTSCTGSQAETTTQQPVPPSVVPDTATSEPQPTQTSMPTNTPEPTLTPTAVPTSTPEISTETQNQMDNIQTQISELRGLAGHEAYQLQVSDQTEIEQFFAGKLKREYTAEEEFQELVTLSYLGLISPTFELREFYQKFYTEQVLGFYEFEKDQMVLSQGFKFGPLERMTYAHEYIHALQDLAYDVDTKLGFTDESCNRHPDRCAATRALLEGDASLASAGWMVANMTAEEQGEVAAAGRAEMPVLSNAPDVYKEDMMFPYTVGTQFVNYLFQQGGWEAVDRAYSNPPLSTEHIMHPERYPADLPVEVALPDLQPVLGEGWELLYQNTLGEWSTLLLLTSGVDAEARLLVDKALPAVTGWGGDAYAVYFNTDSSQVVLVLKTQWDTSNDAAEFFNSLQEHVMARFNLAESEADLIEMFNYMQLGHAQFQLDDDTTYYILSPSEEISMAVLESVVGK